MAAELAILAAALWLGVPPEHAVIAARHDEPEVHVAYLLSEHPGGRYSGACSDAGACGPYQLVALWEAEFGGDRSDPEEAAEIFSQLVERARAKHGSAWRASIKCGREARERCRGPVREWERHEARVREVAGHVRSLLEG